MIKSNKRLLIMLVTAILFLTIPLVAMQWTDEVQWDIYDFIVAGIGLFILAVIVELTLRIIKKKSYRLIILAFMILGFLLLWAEMAVGIFGSPIAGS